MTGRNGEGKSTLLKVIAGLVEPDGGEAASCTCPVIDDFVAHCLDRDPAVLCPLEEGHRSTLFSHLANIAWKLGRRLEWDGEAERFVGCDEANAMLRYDYRPGYAL